MKRITLYAIIAAAGIAVGTVGSLSVTTPKINKLKASMSDMISMTHQMETQSQQKIRTADAQILRLNTELARVRTELDNFKTAQVPQAGAPVEQPAQVVSQDIAKKSPKDNAAQKPATAENPQKIYIVKEGDSFWKIAAAELGNGSRYQEIAKLNPNINTDNMKIGTKLALPPK